VARVLVTGSAQGLGLRTGQLLAREGHAVVLHGRDTGRAADARKALPGVEDVVVGDVSTVAGMRDVAAQANALGRFDAVVHNVGVGEGARHRPVTADGLTLTWAVNVLAPYVLTALVTTPDRLVYLTSGMLLEGRPDLDDVQFERRRWDANAAYCESKLHDLLLTRAFARLLPGARVNAVSPGWVPTRMGGPGAPDDLDEGCRTQVLLATGTGPLAGETGGYWWHEQPATMHPASGGTALQDRLLAYCAERSGVELRLP